MIQLSAAGSSSAWASPGLKRCWVQEPGLAGDGSSRGKCVSHISQLKTNTETLVALSTKPQPTQGSRRLCRKLPSHSSSSVMPGSRIYNAA